MNKCSSLNIFLLLAAFVLVASMTVFAQEGKYVDNATKSAQLVQMRLAGSMCIGCLTELEKKLKQMPGVSRVKVELPKFGGYYNSYTGPSVTGTVAATMAYDPRLISLDQLVAFIRTQGYTARSVVERSQN